MSYRQQQENEEAHNHFLNVQNKFDNGGFKFEYHYWLMHEHDLNPRIIDDDTLIYHIMMQTRLDDFLHEIAFGKQKLNS